MTSNEQAFREQFPVVLTLPVQWGDMDALQHVNNVVYLRWFESARIAYMDRIQFMSRMVSEQIGPILASSSVRYRIPLEYPDSVLVGASVQEFESTQLIQSYGVFSTEKNAVVTTGEARIVMYSFAENRKVSIPDDILGNIRSLEQTGA